MLQVVFKRGRRGNFSVEAKSVLRQFEDLLHARLQRLARFSSFEFQVEALLPGGSASQSGATLAKAQDALGKLLPPGDGFLRTGGLCGRCRMFAKIGHEIKFDII
jgi:hypothetical protein